MTEVAILVSALLLLVGSGFTLIASIGLLRLPDLYTRIHAASKAGTMGSCLVLIALAVHADDVGTVSRALAGVVFFLLTAPVSSHLLAKAAYTVGYRLHSSSVMDEMKPESQEQR